jgi:threonine/homoserine/homoserine lactone efflux protein
VLESIITISIAGLLAGFILSMPIAGPISVLIASNALRGRLHYCNQVNLGASFADFTYVFLAVFGLTKLYALYKPVIPYMYCVGAILLFFLGYRIIKTKIDIEHLEDKTHIIEKIEKKHRGAFYTGFMVNFLNPTLFLGWFTSSFLVISFIASMGFQTGGLAVTLDQNIKEINGTASKGTDSANILEINQLNTFQVNKYKFRQKEQLEIHPYFHLIISICFALFVALGSISWFYLLAFIIVRYRKRIKINIISNFVKSLGILLNLFGLYFVFRAIRIFLNI